MISDERAYKEYLNGNQKAADLLVERYGDPLTLFINGYIHDIQESEDLMIEAFARIFTRERPIDGEGSFKAYLYKTARNLSLRHMQKFPLPLLWTDEADFEPADTALAESGLLKKEQIESFHKGFEKLKADYREALYLVYFEDMSYKNAARVMKKSEKQFANLVARGKKSLKTILERQGFVYADE